MRKTLRRLLIMALLAIGASCGGEPALLVRIAEWPADAALLRVIPSLDGIMRDEIRIPKGSRGFVVTIPEGKSGDLRLQLIAMADDDCKVATAEVEEAIGPALQTTRERDVVLSRLTHPVCALILELPDGRSTAASTPEGLVCNIGALQCEAELPKGSQIQITSTLDPHKHLGVTSTHGNCSTDGVCEFILESGGRSRVELSPRLCTQDGFCWYNALPQGNHLYGAWQVDSNNVWAVGDRGTILYRNGMSWSIQASVTSQTLSGVWGSDAKNVWAVGGDVVGGNGTVVRWNGKAWSAESSGTKQILRGIWGSDAKNIWAVGAAGAIVKWDGAAWSSQESGTSEWLYSVWGSDQKNVWAIGSNGTILKGDYEPPIRTYTDSRMEMSCKPPTSPT